MLLIGRFLRFLIFAAGIAVGYGVAQFVNGNQHSITVAIWPYTVTLPVYVLALVPLAVGLATGYLYTTPARAHEFADHWRSWRAVRRMEKENRELRRSLDKVLDLPDEATPEVRPALERPALEAAVEIEAEPVVVPEVKAAGAKRPGKPAPKTVVARAHAPKANGRVRRRPEPAPAS